jgi:hypothetical protein
MITDTLVVGRSEFEARTGWQLKPEGACKGDICIPLSEPVTGDTVDITAIARQLNLPVVHDGDHGVWAIGPESVSSRALTSVAAPNLTLPTLDGDMFELDSLRGQKVLLVAWSPY